MDKTLTEIANHCKTDKGTEHGSRHGFTDFYETFMAKYRHLDRPVNILEIGIDSGNSLHMYNEYYNGNCNIIGLDIDDKSHLNSKNCTCYQLDQSDPQHRNHYKQYFKENNLKFDIILDDGSHHMDDQILTFLDFNEFIDTDGIYFLEDLHTSLAENGYPLYRKHLQIGYNNANTTLHWLMFDSSTSYLTEQQRLQCEEIIDTVYTYKKHNPYGEAPWKYKSITCAIKKKKK